MKLELVAEGCFPVICNRVVRLHFNLVYNYLETPLWHDILDTQQLEM